jgi:hypothetical protein
MLWKSPNGSDATFFVLDQKFTATLKTRAGILPKRDAMSKRKLSELETRTHTGFTVFPQG